MTRLDWETAGADWPNRAASRFVEAAGLRLHVQVMGQGDALLLLHGAGGATHSFRDLAPILARRFTVIAPDLPGHGFSATPRADGLALPGMARTLGALCAALGAAPRVAAGHSAGAAILARMALDGAIRPDLLVAINGAFRPFRGMAGMVLPTLARAIFWNPLAATLLARAARDDAAVPRLLHGMGSEIDEPGLRFYRRLMRSPAHLDGALGMMANWDLGPLHRSLPHLPVPLLLLAGERDRAVSPAEQNGIARRVPGARIELLKGLGHLAHEEAPDVVAGRMLHHMDHVADRAAG